MTVIRYSGMNIERLSHSSGLFIGTNRQKGRFSTLETNEGFGSIKGENSSAHLNTALLLKAKQRQKKDLS
ncbi:hypothetical protein BN1002_00530 [Bacillus sp. B-jedd]|nr:hypothetical protein BN1002_00530 [Bacillus sp. B-jedd]